MVADMFVSLRGTLAYALITQVWLMVCCIATTCSRTDQYSNATTERDYQEDAGLPKKIVCQAMAPTGEVDLSSDSGYRRL
eukprot:7151775-Pyramimonas_sp.AAC.1